MSEPLLKIRVASNSPVSPAFQETFTQLVDELPTYLSCLLGNHGYQVILARLLVDLYPELQGEPLPSTKGGWDLEKLQVKSFDNFQALHDTNQSKLIFPEFYYDGQSNKLIESKTISRNFLFYHEIGHAIDCLPTSKGFLFFSQASLFIEAFWADLNKLSTSELEVLPYQINCLPRTGREIWADTIAVALGVEWGRVEFHKQWFPLTVEYIQTKVLNRLSKIYDDPDSLKLFYEEQEQRDISRKLRLIRSL
jgi:hypothetical protein